MKKCHFRDVLEVLIILFTMLDATTIWKYTVNGLVQKYGIDPQITKYFLTGLVLFYVLYGGKISKKAVRLILLIFVYNFIYIGISRVNVSYFINTFLLALILWSLFINELISHRRMDIFIRKFNCIIYYLSITTLFLYVFGTLLHIIPAAHTTITRQMSGYTLTFDAPSYFHIMYNTQVVDIFGREIYRNCGICLEATGYAFWLSIAILIELFFTEKVNKVRLTILIATAVTTFATKAYIIIPVLFVLKYFSNEKSRDRAVWAIKKLFGVVLCGVAILLIVFLMRIKSTTSSYMSRIEDLNAAISVWKSNVLFGAGFGVTTVFEQYLNFQKSSSITAGLFRMLAQCGVFIAAEYLGGLLALVVQVSKKERFKMLCTAITIFFFLFVTGTWTNMIMIFVVTAGLNLLVNKTVQYEQCTEVKIATYAGENR